MTTRRRSEELPLDTTTWDLDDESERLIAENLGLATYLAHRFMERGEPFEDLQQVALLALVSAARRFDPSLGYEFAAFATKTIVGELKHHFRDRGWSVRVPRHVQELYLEVSPAVAELEQTLGRSPTMSELAAACGYTEAEVTQAIVAGRGFRARSIDGADGTLDALCDRWTDDSDRIDAVERRDELASLLQALPSQLRLVLKLRFVDELSQSAIAVRLNISQMQVSRLLRRALDALRAAYDSVS